MLFPSFNTLAVLEAQVAALLKQYDSVGPPPVTAPDAAFWPTLCAAALQRATNTVYSRLLSRGWTPTQIAAGDVLPEVELTVAMVFALTDGGMLEAVPDTMLKRYDSYLDPDPQKGLLAGLLLTNYAIKGTFDAQAPEATPGTVQGGNPSSGAVCPGKWSPYDYGFRW